MDSRPEAHSLRLTGTGAGVAAPVGERGLGKKSLGATVLCSHARTFLRGDTGSPPRVFLRNGHLPPALPSGHGGWRLELS